MKLPIPTQLHTYFWGDDLGELDWHQHKKYIIQTLLEKGNATYLDMLYQDMMQGKVG